MKTRTLATLLLVTIAAVSCKIMGEAQGKSRPVQITPHYIMIPGTTISAVDQQKMNEVLRKYSKYPIFRVQPFVGGAPGKVIGKMEAMQIDAGFVADATSYAQKIGLSSITLQLGLHKGMKSATYSPPSDQLVAEMTPILQKYAK